MVQLRKRYKRAYTGLSDDGLVEMLNRQPAHADALQRAHRTVPSLKRRQNCQHHPQ